MVKYEIAGVGNTPTFIMLQPSLITPVATACVNISLEMRVSLPIKKFSLLLSSVSFNTLATDAPILSAKLQVKSSFTIPLAPSVPNIFPIKRPSFLLPFPYF